MNCGYTIILDDMRLLKQENIPYEKMRNKTILVTGATGMLAAYVVHFCMYLNETEGYGIRVLALVRNKEKALEKFSKYENDSNFEFLVQDVCDEIRYDGRIDYIIHAAGNASPRYILDDPVGIIKANTIGTMNVMELARKNSGVRVVYTSTREVYGKMLDNVEAIEEDIFGCLDPMERRACYPESKRIAESILKSYYYQFGVESVVLRIAHSYGPGMIINNDGRVMADFISDVVNERNIVLKSTGDAVRAFCYIADAVSAMFLTMLNSPSGEAYNVANEREPKPIREVAQMLVRLFPERKLKVIFDIPEQMSLGYSKMGRTVLSTKKIEDLGWTPKVCLAEGMKKTVLSFAN